MWSGIVGGSWALWHWSVTRGSAVGYLFECELFVDAHGVTMFDFDSFEIVDGEITDNVP